MLAKRDLHLLHALQGELALKRDWLAVGYVQNLIDHLADEHGLMTNEAPATSWHFSIH